MLVVLVPTVRFAKLVMPVNIFAGIYPETVIDAGDLLNAFEPTEVIDVESMVILFKAEHPSNADAPILLIEEGIVIDGRLEHEENTP
jgi:hypothetical protein